MASRSATDSVLRGQLLNYGAQRRTDKPFRVLNVGILCGNSTRDLVHERFPECEYRTLDQDRLVHPDYALDVQSRAGLAQTTGTFDLVIATSVFYLLSDPDRALRNLLECTNVDGHALLEMDALNSRGERFSCESYTEDLDQSRYVFTGIERQGYYIERLRNFCDHHGVSTNDRDRIATLAMQADGRKNACVWSIDNILHAPFLEARYVFTFDTERPLCCTYVLDLHVKAPFDSHYHPYVTALYRPKVYRLRRLVQNMLRARYVMKQMIKRTVLRVPR